MDCYLISIHALLAESDTHDFTALYNILISIHALLAESDHAPSRRPCPRSNFYPRSPCGERRCARFLCWGLNEFLSTLSLRRATKIIFLISCPFNISIHALLAESDMSVVFLLLAVGVFLSTLSLRRATCPGRIWSTAFDFYPRSPCGERLVALLATGRAGYFYPRSPCGERRKQSNHHKSNQ